WSPLFMTARERRPLRVLSRGEPWHINLRQAATERQGDAGLVHPRVAGGQPETETASKLSFMQCQTVVTTPCSGEVSILRISESFQWGFREGRERSRPAREWADCEESGSGRDRS